MLGPDYGREHWFLNMGNKPPPKPSAPLSSGPPVKFYTRKPEGYLKTEIRPGDTLETVTDKEYGVREDGSLIRLNPKLSKKAQRRQATKAKLHPKTGVSTSD